MQAMNGNAGNCCPRRFGDFSPQEIIRIVVHLHPIEGDEDVLQGGIPSSDRGEASAV